MWGGIISALGWLINYVLGANVVKWAVLALLWYGVSVLFSTLLTLLPTWFDAGGLSGLFNFMTPGMWYFWDYFKGSEAISLIFGAVTARFLIRRIPIIG